MNRALLLTFLFIILLNSSNWAQTDTVYLSKNKSVESKMPFSISNPYYEKGYADFPSYLIEKDIKVDEENIEFQVTPLKTSTYSKFEFSTFYLQFIGKEFYSFSETFGSKARLIVRPFKFNNQGDSVVFLDSFILKSKPKTISQFTKGSKGRVYANHSILSSGNWYKVRISKSGIYKISASEMASMGFSMNNIQTSSVKIYGNGGGMLPEANSEFRYDDLQENAIKIFDLNSNSIFDGNDYFIFYAKGPNTWKYNNGLKIFQHQVHLYDNYAYYFLTISASAGKRITSNTSITQGNTIPIFSYTDYGFYERDTLNLIKSGKVWFGEKFDLQTTYNFPFNFNNVDLTQRATLRVSAAARSTTASSINYSVGGSSFAQTIDAIYPNYTSDYAYLEVDTFSFIPQFSNLNVFASYTKTTTSSIAWFDFAELNVKCRLNMVGSQFSFRNEGAVSPGNTAQFTISQVSANTIIWDITNPLYPSEVQGQLNGSVFTFIKSADSLSEFIAFQPSYLSVEKIGAVNNQDLHSLSNINYIIISHNSFLAEANELANFHLQYDTLSIKVIELSQIYNEFSSGAADVSAIRDFMKMLYDKAGTKYAERPQYLLLFGDGSYDPKSRIANNTNFIPTYQSEASLNPSITYTSDDYFGILDDNEGNNCDGVVDIGVGRIISNTKQQAIDAVNKILVYTSHSKTATQGTNCNTSQNGIKNYADWRNVITFIGDDQDGDIHLTQSDFLAEQMRVNNSNFNIEKIFLDAYTQITTPGGQRYPEAKRDLLARVQKGSLLVNYTGHGGEVGWAHESILEVADILNWSNKNNLPCFVTATCEFSRFDDPGRTSAGEYVFLNTNGGGIALFTTTRLAFSGTNFDINLALINCAFPVNGKKYPRFGDIIKTSKVQSGSSYNNRNFVLLGDPALKLSYPQYDVVTTFINGKPANSAYDTIRALDLVTIKGEIHSNGVKITNFNGRIYPTVYDKVQQLSTLGNDQDSPPLPFKLQKNTLYKGIAEVKNGDFEFSFVVPKDILYAYGLGKISYYAENDTADATGNFQAFSIGGANSGQNTDTDGPNIRLFINDTNFINGGITNENPSLLAFIFDENGVNTIGNGIGHDVVAVLDENTSKPIVLNDYYLSDLNSYKSGKISYPFSKLAEGNHTLSVKVWDVYNNSSDASVDFIVKLASEMTLKNLSNFPNPFTETTNFVFEHNQACEELEVELQVYSTSGKLVYQFNGPVNSTGYRVGPGQIMWNGNSIDGNSLEKGLYVYKISIKSCDGSTTSQTSKLILLK